jgi:anti-sigma factor RsiW
MLQPEMRCREFVEAVTEWMEGVLDDDGRVVLEEHLAICPHCLDYLGELRLAIAVLRGTADSRAAAAPPPAMRAALLAAFRERARG